MSLGFIQSFYHDVPNYHLSISTSTRRVSYDRFHSLLLKLHVRITAMSGSLYHRGYRSRDLITSFFFFPSPLAGLISGKRRGRLLQLCSKSKSAIVCLDFSALLSVSLDMQIDVLIDATGTTGSSFTPITLDHIRGRSDPPITLR